MVTAELAGRYEAPIYGMLAVDKAIDDFDWAKAGLQKPAVSLHGQPDDESVSTLLWDGEWEITWVTFRDMGAAFMIALVGIYILVVGQFRSFTLAAGDPHPDPADAGRHRAWPHAVRARRSRRPR